MTLKKNLAFCLWEAWFRGAKRHVRAAAQAGLVPCEQGAPVWLWLLILMKILLISWISSVKPKQHKGKQTKSTITRISPEHMDWGSYLPPFHTSHTHVQCTDSTICTCACGSSSEIYKSDISPHVMYWAHVVNLVLFHRLKDRNRNTWIIWYNQCLRLSLENPK